MVKDTIAELKACLDNLCIEYYDFEADVSEGKQFGDMIIKIASQSSKNYIVQIFEMSLVFF